MTFSQNCFAELCILHWSTIFGSDTGESTHFKNIFSRLDVKEVSENQITVESVRSNFLDTINMGRSGYADFWKKAHDMRNKYVAHRDDLTDVYLPDIEVCEKNNVALLSFLSQVY